MSSPAHRQDITWLKGLCIIGVLLIHAAPLTGTLVHEYVINRAARVLIVLFGVTSELWWRRHATGSWRHDLAAWYWRRLERLMIPLWAVLAVWWTAVSVLRPEFFAPRFVVATLLGYMPWIGTGWWITLVLQLIALLPFLRWGVSVAGTTIALAVCAAILLASEIYLYEVIELMRCLLRDTGPRQGFEIFYHHWIFAPAHFFSVVAGFVIARRLAHLRALVAVAAGAFGLGCLLRALGGLPQAVLLAVSTAMDVPLTVLLLAVAPAVGLVPALGRVVAWLGDSSWGIYLGQMLIHDGLHVLAYEPETWPLACRWLYCALLLAGSAALVEVGDAVRRRIVKVWTAGWHRA